jgi:signal peptidase II
LGRFALAALVILALDQLTKHVIVESMRLGQAFPVLGLFDIHHVRNQGAAFGIMPSAGALFIVVAVMVLAGVAIYWRHIERTDTVTKIALGFVTGGTVGNLIDRLRFGYVIDFIDLRWWPVFNVADSAICVGVALLMYKILKAPRES